MTIVLSRVGAPGVGGVRVGVTAKGVTCADGFVTADITTFTSELHQSKPLSPLLSYTWSYRMVNPVYN